MEISQRIASLSDALKECMVMIARLSKLDGITTDAARLELASNIHQVLKESEQELELLNAEVEDGSPFTSKLNKITEDLKIARLQYRKAQLSAKKNAEVARQKERELLLGGASGRSTPDGRARRNEKLSKEDLIVNASTDVTTALKRTHTLLSSELSRSQFASETLNASTQALKDLSSRYSVFDDILSSSRLLIQDLMRKNKSDRWYYEKAISILLGTLLWIIIRRLFWGPIYLMLFLPFKLIWWTLSMVAMLIPGLGESDIGPVQSGGAVNNAFVPGVPKAEVNGIPESLLTPESAGSAEDGKITDEPSMLEQVVRDIKEGQSESRNPKSRRMDYDPAEEQRYSREQEAEKLHDEL
ncbi:Protein transport protein sec20 [Rhizina undulata]